MGSTFEEVFDVDSCCLAVVFNSTVENESVLVADGSALVDVNSDFDEVCWDIEEWACVEEYLIVEGDIVLDGVACELDKSAVVLVEDIRKLEEGDRELDKADVLTEVAGVLVVGVFGVDVEKNACVLEVNEGAIAVGEGVFELEDVGCEVAVNESA